jgi:predicted phage terminase large subunit-like protein
VENKLNSLSEHEQTAAILRETAEHGSFAEYCIAVDKSYQLEWFHDEIARKLENGYRRLMAGEDVRLMIFMPPRHGKSDMTTQKFTSWVLGKESDIPIMVSSYSDELATDFGQKTRDIMQSAAYMAMFDTRLRVDARAKGKWLTDSGGSYTAVGIGGAQTGKGFKIGIIDDPFKNREEADSEVIRESRHKWYQSTFSTREEGNSMIIFILTRWHEDDLAGRVLKDAAEAKKRGEEYEEWEIIEYKAIATEDEAHRETGEALWPAKFSLPKLMSKKAVMGSYEFSALYQQTPVDEENRKFKQAWFNYRRYEDVRQRETYNVMTIDPRGKDDIKLGKDYIGITTNFIDTDNNWNLMSYRDKLSATQLIDLMFTNWQRYNLHVIGIEDNQFTQGLMVSVNSEMKLRGIYMNIVLLKHGGAQKELRIEALVPRYEHGAIYHLTYDSVNQCEDLEDELKLFPKAANDDASDSCAYQTQLADRPSQRAGQVVKTVNALGSAPLATVQPDGKMALNLDFRRAYGKRRRTLR